MKRTLIFLLLATAVAAAPARSQTLELRTAAQDSDPKYFINQEKAMDGLCVDIIKAIEEADPEIIFVGYDTFMPFKRMENNLEEGLIDAFFGFVKNDSRSNRFIFIDPPLYTMKHVVAVRMEDDIAVSSMEDLKIPGENGIVLTLAGTSTARYLRKNGVTNIDDGAIDIAANFKKLLMQRGRFFYYHDLGLTTSIKKLGLEKKVKILPISFREYPQYVVFSRHASKAAIEKVGSALQGLKERGGLDAIFNKYVDMPR